MPTFGKITTFAGTGAPGYTGDGGPAERATLHDPFVGVFDRDGNLFIAESGNNILRRIERGSRRISTVAGSGVKGYSGDDGPALKATFDDLVCVAVTDSGDAYLCDRLNHRIRRLDARRGTLETVLGSELKADTGDNGPGVKATVKEPHDCVLDGKGGLFVVDVAACRVRRLDLKTGIVTTFAGTGQRAHAGDGGPAARASFAGSRAAALDSRDGTLYVVEREGNVIRRIDGKTTVISTIAGTGQKGYTGDGGPALKALFNGPKGLHCDRDGNLYIADTENHAIRCLDTTTGLITTVAGGRRGPEGDGGSATAASLNRPHGMTLGPDGALYIGDSENHRIRRAELHSK